jgi:hypothetical protein
VFASWSFRGAFGVQPQGRKSEVAAFSRLTQLLSAPRGGGEERREQKWRAAMAAGFV